MQTHETVQSFRKIAAGSNRKFGITLGFVFGFLAFWPLVHHHAPRYWLLAIAALLLGAGVLFPERLTPLNRAWFKLGLALNALVGPLIMGVLVFRRRHSGRLDPAQAWRRSPAPQARTANCDLLDAARA